MPNLFQQISFPLVFQMVKDTQHEFIGKMSLLKLLLLFGYFILFFRHFYFILSTFFFSSTLTHALILNSRIFLCDRVRFAVCTARINCCLPFYLSLIRFEHLLVFMVFNTCSVLTTFFLFIFERLLR